MEILWCNYSNETSSAVLSHGATYFTYRARKQKQTSSLNYFTTTCKSYFFSWRNTFKKQPHFVFKNNTRWHEGFKLPLCTFYVVMQIQANFTAIAKSIFCDFYWLFLCLTSLALFLLLWLRLSFTIYFRNERKRVYKIAWQSKRFRPHISHVNFHFILGVNTDCRRIL